MHICKFELLMHATAVAADAWAPHTGTFPDAGSHTVVKIHKCEL